jgi:hypothetical protein
MAISTTEECVKRAEDLSERVCLGCLIDDCEDRSGLCLRTYVTGARSGRKRIEQILEAIDIRLNQHECGHMAMRVLVDARDHIRAVRDHTHA